MTEQEARYCETYIPSPPDETLDAGIDYYTKDTHDRVVKGWLTEIAMDVHGNSIYRIRNKKGFVHSWASDERGYMKMGFLYDNKQDCKDGTHDFYDGWERLRELQKKENHNEHRI